MIAGLSAGATSGAVMEGFDIGGATETAPDTDSAGPESEVSEQGDQEPAAARNSNQPPAAAATSTGSATPVTASPLEAAMKGGTVGDEVSPALESPLAAASETAPEVASQNAYTVESGDNLWDILEGQTTAGEFSQLEGLTDIEKQEVIAKVVERLNGDAALREQFAMGDTADMLYAGETIDKEALNTLIGETLTESGEVEVGDEAPAEVSTTETPVEAVATEQAPVTTPPEVTTTRSEQFDTVSVRHVDEYARNYPGGFNKFHQDFDLFVVGIQGPTERVGFFERLFGGGTARVDLFKEYASYPVNEFRDLDLNQESNKNIQTEDYQAWRQALRTWTNDGLVIRPGDRLSDVAETAFIRSLEHAKTT